jgi:hypothetical protein
MYIRYSILGNFKINLSLMTIFLRTPQEEKWPRLENRFSKAVGGDQSPQNVYEFHYSVDESNPTEKKLTNCNISYMNLLLLSSFFAFSRE